MGSSSGAEARLPELELECIPGGGTYLDLGFDPLVAVIVDGGSGGP